MRRYQLTVNSNQYEIDVDEISATDFTVSIDGQQVTVTLTSQADMADALITPEIEARSTAAAVAARTGVPVAPKVPATMRAASPRTPSPAVAGGADLAYSMSAPMPGVIIEINATPGTSVEKGDVVMVLEAMKMKNDLHASRAGVVESVDVSQGDQVKYGQVLLRFAKD